jgi:uncharacterized membrane protein YkoI
MIHRISHSLPGKVTPVFGMLCVCLVAWGGVQACTASAHAGCNDSDALMVAQNDTISLDEAVAQVQEKTGGRVLSAETQEHEGRLVHRIRVLIEEQRVRHILVDVATGEWQ